MGAKSGFLTLTLLILHPWQNKTRSVLKWLKSAKSSGSHLIAWEVIDWSTVWHRLSLSFPRHYYNARRPIISYLNRIDFWKFTCQEKLYAFPCLFPFLAWVLGHLESSWISLIFSVGHLRFSGKQCRSRNEEFWSCLSWRTLHMSLTLRVGL